MFFVLIPTEDGLKVDCLERAELLKRLNEEYYGFRKILREIPSAANHNYWNHSLVIIEGQVVAPKPVTKVTEWELP